MDWKEIQQKVGEIWHDYVWEIILDAVGFNLARIILEWMKEKGKK